MNARPYGPDSPERVASALTYIDPTDRDLWVKIAMATKATLGDAGFDVWDTWSQRADSYDAAHAREVWRSTNANGGTGSGTLFYLAREAGWEDDGSFQAPKPLTEAEIAERKARVERDQRERDEKHAAAAKQAEKLRGAGKREIADHPYVKLKGDHLPFGAGIRRGKFPQRSWDDALLVPIYGPDQQVMSIEAINVDGQKIGLLDGARAGGFYPLAKFAAEDINPDRIVIIAEGLATAAACQHATKYPAVAAFSLGNLRKAAESVRKMAPDVRIVIAADLGSQSEAKARAAAIALGAYLAVPEGIEDEGTDFWDVSDAKGAAVTKAIIEAAIAAGPLEPEPNAAPALEPKPAPKASAHSARVLEPEPAPVLRENPILEPKADQLPAAAGTAPANRSTSPDGQPDSDSHFAILGFDRGTIFIYSHGRGQIMTTSASSLSKASGLLEFAPLNWWEYHFQKAGKSGMGLDAVAAADWVVRQAESRGIYDATRVRGRGVWSDAGRLVFHHGNFLTVDGAATSLSSISSRYVYEAAAAVAPAAKIAMTADEGAALTETAGRFRWAHSGSGLLMAGWAFLAPVCGALEWRPHIWVTGAAGSGKSTLLDKFLARLMPEGWMLALQGSSSEAGVRQKLKGDARPVLIDEFESNTEADAKRIESVLTLIRQSSSETGAEVARGTVSGNALTFNVRSVFCLASVGVSLHRQTDEDRLTKLELKADAVGDWDTLERELSTIAADRTYGQRLFARALKMLPVIREAAAVFSRAAGKHFGRQRDGDQFGTLLAGVWCLQNDRAPSEMEAMVLIRGQDWAGLGAGASLQTCDSSQALDALLSATIRDGSRAASVGELLDIVRGGPSDGPNSMTAADAHSALQRNGIRFSPDFKEVLFAKNSQALLNLVEGTPFYNDLHGRLSRIKGGRTHGRGERQRFAGTNLMFVAVNTDTVFSAAR